MLGSGVLSGAFRAKAIATSWRQAVRPGENVLFGPLVGATNPIVPAKGSLSVQ